MQRTFRGLILSAAAACLVMPAIAAPGAQAAEKPQEWDEYRKRVPGINSTSRSRRYFEKLEMLTPVLPLICRNTLLPKDKAACSP